MSTQNSPEVYVPSEIYAPAGTDVPVAPRRSAWLAALVFAAAVSVVAIQAKQAGPAPLVGTIYDATGAVLPGVTLTLSDASGVGRKATSDSAGRFDFPTIAAGRYRISVSLACFRTLDT